MPWWSTLINSQGYKTKHDEDIVRLGITNNMMLRFVQNMGEFQIEGGKRWSMIGLLYNTIYFRLGNGPKIRFLIAMGISSHAETVSKCFKDPKDPEFSRISMTGSTFEPTGQGHWCSPELWRTSVKASGFWCWCFLVSLNVERCWKNREYHENIMRISGFEAQI